MYENIETIISETTGKEYMPSKCVRIINTLQACLYMKHSVELLDIYPSKDFKTGAPIMVYVFDREASSDAYDKWNNYELK